MNKIIEMEETKERYIQRFEDRITSETPAFLKTVRMEALNCFEDLGYPTTKMEYWKYTNVKPIQQNIYNGPNKSQPINISKVELNKFLIAGFDANVLVFINGCFVKQYSQL